MGIAYLLAFNDLRASIHHITLARRSTSVTWISYGKERRLFRMFLHFCFRGRISKFPHLARRSQKRGIRGKSIRFSFAFLPKRIGVFFFDMATKGNWVLIITTSGCQRGRGLYHAAFHKGREEKGFCVRAHDEGGAGILAFFHTTRAYGSQGWMGCGSEWHFFRYGEFFLMIRLASSK